MSRAKIIGGVWTRNVPDAWERRGEWRTDIFKTTLSRPELEFANYVLGSTGRSVLIPANELRRIVLGGSDHYDGGKIWGPFMVNPTTESVDGQPAQMQISKPGFGHLKKGGSSTD
jgi:hypothetical protein